MAEQRPVVISSEAQLLQALHDEHAGALWSYVVSLIGGDHARAQDVVQETLLRAWRNAHRVSPGAMRPWLFTTARRLVIDAYRARQARPIEAPVDADALRSAVAVDALDAALDGVLVADALAALSPAHRSVLIDCFYRGHTAAEVAQARGLPAGTVRSRIHYALRALGLALQERGVSGP